MQTDRGFLLTEQSNPHSQNLDTLTPLELVALFNQEDAYAVAAVAKEQTPIAQAIAIVTTTLQLFES